ncbi:MAG: TetR/AcrR family transcriptional regulator [Pseudomonadota bacterium]
MPRNLSFDVEQARADIMRTFWERGYEGTSLSDLERATSLVRTSLYNSFGNKPDMFLESLTMYHRAIEAQIDAATKDCGTDALCDVIAAIMEGRDKTAGLPAGCLMVSAATQSAALEDRHLQRVRAYRQMLALKAWEALERDRSSGKLAPTFDTASASEFLVCVVWGALAAQCLENGANSAAAGAAQLRTTMTGWVIG